MKHCVVIGSGLGGLSTGLILSRNGYRVTVLEQHYQAGGCLQCFIRGGEKFETGMHFVGSADEGQVLWRLMRLLELEEIPLSRLDPTGYDIIKLAGNEYRIGNGRDAFIEGLSADFPDQRDNLARYFDAVREFSRGSSSFGSVRDVQSDVVLNMRYQTVSMNTVLDEFFGDSEVRHVIAGNLPLYSARLDRTPFALHAFLMDFYNQSAFRIIGGSDVIADTLIRRIKENGGEVRTNSKVTRILCDNRRATGVEVNESEFIDADVIVSTIHPASTVRLLDTTMIRPAYRRRIEGLPQSSGAFTLNLKFKPGTVEYMNSNYYSYVGLSPWGCEDYDEETWPKGYLYMHACDEPNQKFARRGTVLTYMNMEDLKEWENTTVGRRGDDYRRFKEERASKLLARLESDFPGISKNIERVYTSTPLTYRDYTGAIDGGMYGIAKDVTLGPGGRVTHRTKVPNLFLAGQSINSHGILGVIIGSLVATSELTDFELKV